MKSGALFAGIGGFCRGFENSGIGTSWAVENDLYASETYRLNHPKTRIILNDFNEPADIRGVSVSKNDLEPVDIFHAGFPCQSFSTAGNRSGFNDVRGQLFFEIIRLIKEFKDRQPSVIVLENVPNLRGGDGGRWFIEITKEIQKAGYWFKQLNSQELDTYNLTNLPQRRNRLFMVGFSIRNFRNGKFDFPHKRNTAVKDLRNFVDFEGIQEDKYYYLPTENKYYEMIKKLEKKGNFCLYHLRRYFVRVKNEGVCPTLTANMGVGGHNVPFLFDDAGLRKLTEFECLNLQGFPKTFKFPENIGKSQRYTQIGNSVSVPISEMLAEKVKQKIQNERKNG